MNVKRPDEDLVDKLIYLQAWNVDTGTVYIDACFLKKLTTLRALQ